MLTLLLSVVDGVEGNLLRASSKGFEEGRDTTIAGEGTTSEAGIT